MQVSVFGEQRRSFSVGPFHRQPLLRLLAPAHALDETPEDLPIRPALLAIVSSVSTEPAGKPAGLLPLGIRHPGNIPTLNRCGGRLERVDQQLLGSGSSKVDTKAPVGANIGAGGVSKMNVRQGRDVAAERATGVIAACDMRSGGVRRWCVGRHRGPFHA